MRTCSFPKVRADVHLRRAGCDWWDIDVLNLIRRALSNGHNTQYAISSGLLIRGAEAIMSSNKDLRTALSILE